MPFYDYSCGKCKNVFEVQHGMTETPPVMCPVCFGKKCQKLISRNISGHVSGREIWDYNDVRDKNPKYVKSRDGKTRRRYDSSSDGYGKGMGS